ncbi:sensor histidine kinase [Pelagibacterium xiamenense]|uniref:sensor histidine kinase n=1 Tax=Pelagibacterium xiamenense TaxID=2901140 RepID=UPI001E2F52A3|nr:ATP-binding protein [Pelagibacterium xiamenense]
MFTAYEVYRAVAAFHERLGLAAALTAAEAGISAATGRGFDVIVTDPDDIVLSSTLDAVVPGAILSADTVTPALARAEAETETGRVVVTAPYTTLLGALAPKLGFAGALALLSVLLASRGQTDARPRAHSAFEPVVDAVPHGLARWTADGQLVCANAAFAHLLRIEAEALVPGADYALVSRAMTGKISARPVVETEHRRLVELARSDGSVITLDERPCTGGGFVTVVSDITERKAADRMLSAVRNEQRLLARQYHEEKIRAEAASRAKSAFLAHLSHDIRTPLNHIIGFADLMRLEAFGPLGDDNYRTYLGDIKTSGEKLLERFAAILEFAELESGCKALECEPLPLSAFFSDTRARYAKQAARAGIRFQVASRVEGEIRGDRHYLDLMVGHLIDNAIRHTPRGGEIRMAAWTADDGVVIELTDTGTGMPPETLSQLSQPFVLADASATKSHEGVGLGIAMARTIAELSGGRLAIDSMEGVGTTVAICLPLHIASDSLTSRAAA